MLQNTVNILNSIEIGVFVHFIRMKLLLGKELQIFASTVRMFEIQKYEKDMIYAKFEAYC